MCSQCHQRKASAEADLREHNMVRFENGVPRSVWYSQHEYGEAYTYAAVQKSGKRPLAFSAKGSHANYVKAENYDLHAGSKYINSRFSRFFANSP